MEIRLLAKENIEIIKKLYKDIKQKTFTIWEDDYPSDELIVYDIERKGLYGVFNNDELIAVCFIGERCEDGEETYTWKDNFKKRGTFARIGVSPKFQNQGIGYKLVEFALNELKSQGFDGVRILLGVNNENAIKLYNKFGFINCGQTTKYGQDYFLYELRLKTL